jgi:RimJ/RimL family protein N-acetyltransferase
MTLTDVLPVFGLRLTTPRLAIHLPDPAELAALGVLAAAGIHDSSVQPFGGEWTDQPIEKIPASVVQYAWAAWSKWRPGTWELGFVVTLDGVVIGTQAIGASRFAIRREVATGSWLGRAYQGRGLGFEMRAAVLALGFDGLAADFASTSAYLDNAASQGVSRKLGYQPNGTQRDAIRGTVQELQHLRLTREQWAEHRTVEVTIEGLDACRDWLIGEA